MPPLHQCSRRSGVLLEIVIDGLNAMSSPNDGPALSGELLLRNRKLLNPTRRACGPASPRRPPKSLSRAGLLEQEVQQGLQPAPGSLKLVTGCRVHSSLMNLGSFGGDRHGAQTKLGSA